MPVYKDDNTGKWYCKFYYADHVGNKKQKLKRGFERKKDAQQWERTFLDQFAKDPTISFSELYRRYMEHTEARVRKSTLSSKKCLIQKHILPYFKNFKIADITAADVARWQTDMINNSGMSDTSLRVLNGQLSAIFNYAVNYAGLSKSPCRDTMGSTKAKNVDFWTPEEYGQFIATLKNNILYYTLFEVLYYCGLRIGEAMALTIADIDFERSTISVNKTRYDIKGGAVTNPPKTRKSERLVTMPDFLTDELREYIRHIYHPAPDTRLFDICCASARHTLKLYSQAAGVKQIRLHDLRHSHASMLINLGANPVLVADRLGHENPEITLKTYSHLFPSTQADIVGKIKKI